MAKKKQIELTIEEKLQNALVPKEEQPYKIPNNWCWTYFKDIFYIENGYAFKKIDYKKKGIPLVRISNIENGIVNINECIYVNKLEKNRHTLHLHTPQGADKEDFGVGPAASGGIGDGNGRDDRSEEHTSEL